MELTPEIEKIIVLIYLAILFIVLIVVASAYNEYCELVKDENKDLNTGGWVAGTYWFNLEVLVPINEVHENQTIQKATNRHTKALWFFWIWLAVVMPFLITLNSI